MNEGNPTILYIKTHTVTGLKYFGKTTCLDAHKYQGSGVDWQEHITEHGYDGVETEIYGIYTDLDLAYNDAVEFSIANDIVKSPLWANKKPETLDGGWGHINDDPEQMQKRKDAQREWRESLTEEERIAYNASRAVYGEKNHFYGKVWEEGKHPRSGAKLTEEHIDLLRQKVKGKTNMKDAITGELVGFHDINHPKYLSGEWVNIKKGQEVTESHREKLREAAIRVGNVPPNAKGKFWWNNGTINKLCTECPEGFVPGKVYRPRKKRRSREELNTLVS